MRARFLALLLVLGGCVATFHDPRTTGVVIDPPPGDVEGPVTLLVANERPGPVACVIVEGDGCPSVGEQVQPWQRLSPGDVVRVEDVSCAVLDVACWDGEVVGTERPIRQWGWVVLPPDETGR
jgi:hypothetical protein